MFRDPAYPRAVPHHGVVSYVGEQANGPGTIAIFAVLAIAAMLGLFVKQDNRFELGTDSIRLTTQERWFGVPRPVSVVFEGPLPPDAVIKQVNTRTPSQRGGWIHASAIHFPGGHVLDESHLGSRQDAASPYNRVAKLLAKRYGARFTVEEKV